MIGNPPVEDLPGYRRRFRIVPQPHSISALLEDDLHCMRVTLHHDGAAIIAVEGETLRAPWTTCPGAHRVLEDSFLGASLDHAAAKAVKRHNCTHLYDLAVLAAAHARDAEPTVYDVCASDPVAGFSRQQLRRNGLIVLAWETQDDILLPPATAAGHHLLALRDWIATLGDAEREHARILQWASLVAHGRWMPEADQSDPNRMAGSCHTFQPGQIEQTEWIARRIDFSRGGREPLDSLAGAATVNPAWL
ncbi:MAG: DUF2889 domain-containing protein [Sphingomonadales bacterium]|nr:DUF2889 domain-containing protein [Sphingomonadales bacterium]